MTQIARNVIDFGDGFRRGKRYRRFDLRSLRFSQKSLTRHRNAYSSPPCRRCPLESARGRVLGPREFFEVVLRAHSCVRPCRRLSVKTPKLTFQGQGPTGLGSSSTPCNVYPTLKMHASGVVSGTAQLQYRHLVSARPRRCRPLGLFGHSGFMAAQEIVGWAVQSGSLFALFHGPHDARRRSARASASGGHESCPWRQRA
jgi:hypothetical protein